MICKEITPAKNREGGKGERGKQEVTAILVTSQSEEGESWK